MIDNLTSNILHQTQQDISVLKENILTKSAIDYNDLLIRVDALYHSFHNNISSNVAPVIAPALVGSNPLPNYQPSLDI